VAERARPRKPDRVCADPLRGGQVWQILDETSMVVRIHAEQHAIRDYTVARALFPASVGTPIACTIANIGAPLEDYVITSIRFSRFAGHMGPGSDQERSVARGEFHPGHVEYEWTGESEFWDWAPDETPTSQFSWRW
jgi:hypothetical protein